MSRRRLGEKSAWRVTIPAHTIQVRAPLTGTYHVAACSVLQFERARASAIEIASRAAHVRASVPAWLPYLRQTIAVAQAQRCIVDLEVAA